MNTNRKTARILKDVKIDVKIKLSGLWVAAMFSWVYGDLLRIYSGDFVGGDDITGGVMSLEMLWLVSAITMIVPGAMVFLSLALKGKANRWTNIIMGIFYTVYNLSGLSTYPSAYDRFLIFVSVVFTALIAWYAWKWPKQEA
ncbi:MAG: hypothetical protein JRJ00_15465 [Deltaproteobacteria bacterium]|nr:hypothetical protein [Deltaproteobacteria bacterium]